MLKRYPRRQKEIINVQRSWLNECYRLLVLKNSVGGRVLLSGEFLPIRVFLLAVVAYALAIAGCALRLRNRTSRFRFCATAAR